MIDNVSLTKWSSGNVENTIFPAFLIVAIIFTMSAKSNSLLNAVFYLRNHSKRNGGQVDIFENQPLYKRLTTVNVSHIFWGTKLTPLHASSRELVPASIPFPTFHQSQICTLYPLLLSHTMRM